MAQTFVLIEYDLQTWAVTRIYHPEDDFGLTMFKVEPGRSHILAPHKNFPVRDGKPDYGLEQCEDEIERATGRRPPKR
jgi:hypothetical protein